MKSTMRRMGLIVAALGLAFGVAGEAGAETIIHAFAASNADGETLTGRFVYDDERGPSYTGSPESGEIDFYGENYWFEYEFEGKSNVFFVGQNPGETEHYEYGISNGDPALNSYMDNLEITAFYDNKIFIQVRLQNSDATAFDTHLTLPSSLDLDKFDVYRSISVFDRIRGISFGGTIDTLVLDHSGLPAGVVIPEPSTLALVGLAAVPLGLIARRRTCRDRLTAPV